ncbi:MAG: hypothetical protein COV91_04785 [Candidatus Taylorbacteria bacterium CG11_big_fil_rev_8_21_14_0_20_46_11]|uniref:Uncharacterized protein n=1 Tax=Candidatus Taylorbacteria bacterium CG11_big_fil_rev_8_21_14_0_20_46_11 TaxID=1975025 RepID=A0A2H0KAP4_9BACT|nr:MAG: hypothetical protein COV91_04785 [Candidatus Taylorbacteria bacterium CG11_big_fil_rev_8_21_14_0_20_46_11]
MPVLPIMYLLCIHGCDVGAVSTMFVSLLVFYVLLGTVIGYLCGKFIQGKKKAWPYWAKGLTSLLIAVGVIAFVSSYPSPLMLLILYPGFLIAGADNGILIVSVATVFYGVVGSGLGWLYGKFRSGSTTTIPLS